MEKILNTLFPQKCIFCKNIGQGICDSCLYKINIEFNNNCLICQQGSITGYTHLKCMNANTPESFLSVFRYSRKVRKVIRRSKYGQKQFALLKHLTYYGSKELKLAGYTFPKDSLVVPIPISKARLKERGFNQAGTIATILAKQFNLKTRNNVLVRSKDTKPQYSNNRKERFDNVKDVFRVKNPQEVGKSILLVDDICTSGATLIEATNELSKYAHSVNCFTLARKVLNSKGYNYKY